jgi:hypothetical protein
MKDAAGAASEVDHSLPRFDSNLGELFVREGSEVGDLPFEAKLFRFATSEQVNVGLSHLCIPRNAPCLDFIAIAPPRSWRYRAAIV